MESGAGLGGNATNRTENRDAPSGVVVPTAQKERSATQLVARTSWGTISIKLAKFIKLVPNCLKKFSFIENFFTNPFDLERFYGKILDKSKIIRYNNLKPIEL